ncbi:hypothetical protein JCM11251_006825 [Rhodosporidiobolus azoricus]
MPHKLLVANRGEIALRVLRSADELQIPTASIYTEADSSAPHVFKAGETALVPNYLDGDAIVEVCKKLEVTMVHPGYGFLSENTEFAAKVEAAGIVFLGPTPEQIESMGLKHEARARAIAAGVPVLPGSELVEDVEAALKQAERVGWPIMLKATGGGGGRGTAVCWDEKELRGSFQSTMEMTETLFGGGLFVEKFVPRARHIEIQVFGDGHGKVIHAGERECSAQRRHQKVLEEAPSPFILLHPELGEEMYFAAVRLCELIKYRSAGTVEFLVDDTTAKYYFLELNSRIQVEHAVRPVLPELTRSYLQTEMVRPGLDLVALMIKLGLSHSSASSFVLPDQASVATAHGHAIEARIYAEIPHHDFKPSPGLLQEVSFPSDASVRVDSWVDTGSVVSPFYDPMVAKLIVHGTERKEAIKRLDQAISDTILRGTATNLSYLQTINSCPEWVAGNVTTKFLDTFPYTLSCIEVVDGGLSTTVQDGRPRLSPTGDGIPRGGPMDSLAAKAANLLVGNKPEVECFEAILSGPTFKFTTTSVVAVTGAEAEIYRDDAKKPMWSRFVVEAGSTLEIGACEGVGKSVYIAVKGGFPEVPFFAGSKSTFAAGKIGGVQGREIAAGDIITLAASAAPSSSEATDFTIPSAILPAFPHEWTLAALPGPHADADYLTKEDRASLYSTSFVISADSNRMGLRLQGLKPLKFSRNTGEHGSNVVDHGYSEGAINLNGDTPVLLAADGPDCGGLACVVGVVTSEWWKMGQLRPGDSFRLVEPTVESLPAHIAKQQQWLGALNAAIKSGSFDDVPPFPLNVETEKRSTDGVLLVREKTELSPKLSFRQSGDGGILVEVGSQTRLSFRTRLITELWERRLREKNIDGIYAYIQNIASILIKFHPVVLPQQDLLELLTSTFSGLPEASLEVSIPSRRIDLPVTFNDSVIKETIRRYQVSTGRKKAVYLPDNLDYLAKATGVDGVEGVVKTFTSSDWFCTSRAFFLGLPFLFPLDARALLASQKYNPTRTYTPSGTLGYAGVQAAIYPVDSPGGYMVIGRTLTPWSSKGRYGKGYEGHFLLKSFDVVRWVAMEEKEFAEVEKAFTAGSFMPKVEEITISAKEMAELERSTAEEVEQRATEMGRNLAELAKEEAVLVAEYHAELEKAKQEAEAAAGSGGKAGGSHSGTPLKSPVLAAVRSISVSIGDVLSSDTVPVKVEAMKTEIAIKVGRALVGKKVTGIAVEVGDVVKPGEAVLYCD